MYKNLKEKSNQTNHTVPYQLPGGPCLQQQEQQQPARPTSPSQGPLLISQGNSSCGAACVCTWLQLQEHTWRAQRILNNDFNYKVIF